jgi:hypothetical protein
MTVLGLLLLGVGVVMVVAASGGPSNRVPTQVRPRAVAVVPLFLGVALIVADLPY